MKIGLNLSFLLLSLVLTGTTGLAQEHKKQTVPDIKILAEKAKENADWVKVKVKTASGEKTYKGKVISSEDLSFHIKDPCPVFCGYDEIKYADVISFKKTNRLGGNLRSGGKNIITSIPAAPIALLFWLGTRE